MLINTHANLHSDAHIWKTHAHINVFSAYVGAHKNRDIGTQKYMYRESRLMNS